MRRIAAPAARNLSKVARVMFTADGDEVAARAGASVAAALIAAGRPALGRSPRDGRPRGAFCLMGVCQQCVMRIDGVRRPACMVEARAGMVVESLA
ncbi:sarcosine oxidase subunit alpha [Rubrimonas cliftonensis]|uniref:Sarcosine oxidase subunit alpha n=2 Tax=Rubrimonas cliftonensis TaxID=89524 RepID=A0A1H3YPE7_9RHOB|nr:sarcosine oxidase subunit alpha [Rubrimonas cliftonensis]